MTTKQSSLATADVETNVKDRALCVVLADTSPSMEADGKIDALNRGLQEFHSDSVSDERMKDSLELALVTFDSTVRRVIDASLPPNDVMPALTTAGSETHMLDAIAEGLLISEAWKQQRKASGLGHYRPWIVLLTDGQPVPLDKAAVQAMGERIRQQMDGKHVHFFAIGVGDANMDILRQLSHPKVQPAKLLGVRFAEFFEWLSSSMGAILASTPGSHVQLPGTDNWTDNYTS